MILQGVDIFCKSNPGKYNFNVVLYSSIISVQCYQYDKILKLKKKIPAITEFKCLMISSNFQAQIYVY